MVKAAGTKSEHELAATLPEEHEPHVCCASARLSGQTVISTKGERKVKEWIL